MKIQCSCGTKIAFDITPDMATNPVQFICPGCGLDNSSMVNQLIRQELGVSSTTPAPPPLVPAPRPSIRISTPAAKVTPAATPTRPALRIITHTPATPPVEVAPEPAPMGKEFCLKHPNQQTVHRCLVCGIGMCPECLTLFGYICSPLCKSKSVSHGLNIPVYAQQKSVVEARRWQKIGRIGTSIGVVAALLLGFWGWYAWFGSVPKVAYALCFPERAASGAVRLCDANQLVFLRGGQLGRIDMKQPQPLWTVQLVDASKFKAPAEQSIQQLVKARAKYSDTAEDPVDFKIPPVEEMISNMVESAEVQLQLHVAGEHLWVADGEKLVHYDWQTGKPGQTVTLDGGAFGLHRKGDELLLAGMNDDQNGETIRHINLLTGETSQETMAKPLPPTLVGLLTQMATNPTSAPTAPAKQTTKGRAAVGKSVPSAVMSAAARVIAANEVRRPSTPLDPERIAAQADGLSLAGRLALPALIAAARNQQRLSAEMEGEAKARPPTELDRALAEWDNTQVLRASDGPVQFTRTLLERKIIERETMKAPPKRAALEGEVSAGKSMSLANDMLNEMQRERGSKVTEDHSYYLVTVRRSDNSNPVWTNEFNGPPSFHPLKTVDIITAGTTAIAIDHHNKQLWQAALNFPVVSGQDEFENETEALHLGEGPCVERGDTIYICDQGVLSCLDRATGNVRWRLPSVGIRGILFDDAGMIYVNTTTAGPESIRYAKQIDINNQTLTQILKVDPKTGKTLWSQAGCNHICYRWKKYLYTTDSFPGDDPNDSGINGISTGLEREPFVRIRRIDANSGRVLWEHVQKRYPLDIQFHENTIQLLFKKEVQHLKFIVL